MARRGLTPEDRRRLRQEVERTALRVVREAKRRAPVDTGRLRASITAASGSGETIFPAGNEAEAGDAVGEPSNEYAVRVGTNVKYASFLEYGTINMDPRPYLRPAIDFVLSDSD